MTENIENNDVEIVVEGRLLEQAICADTTNSCVYTYSSSELGTFTEMGSSFTLKNGETKTLGGAGFSGSVIDLEINN
jgi:hypothetical protein